MNISSKLASVALLVTMAACASPSDSEDVAFGGNHPDGTSTPESGSDASDEPSSDTVFTQTVVNVKDDGSYDVKTRPITLAEELAEVEARKATAAGVPVLQTRAYDPGCAPQSEWLYDQANFVGNRICFSDPTFNYAWHDLTQFSRGTMTCSGRTYTRTWAGGFSQCIGGFPLAVSNDTNAVRSIFTGNGGVAFINSDNSFQSGFWSIYHQYPSVSTKGRYAETHGSPLN